MTTTRIRISLAMIVALGLTQGCSNKKPTETTPNTTETVAEKSPFPPPPIEIGSDDDPNVSGTEILIYWKQDGTRINSVTETETYGRVSDEMTWRIKHFKVVDNAGIPYPNVEWVIIRDGLAEKATISRVGGQFYWKVAGTTPEICSWYNVSTEVPACVHNGSPLGFTGVPASLFGFLPTFHARFKKGSTWVEEDVASVQLRGETCK